MVRHSAMIRNGTMLRIFLFVIVMILILGQATSLPMKRDPNQRKEAAYGRAPSRSSPPYRHTSGYDGEGAVHRPSFNEVVDPHGIERSDSGLRTPTHSRQPSPESLTENVEQDDAQNFEQDHDALVKALQNLQLGQNNDNPRYPEGESSESNEGRAQQDNGAEQDKSKTTKNRFMFRRKRERDQ